MPARHPTFIRSVALLAIAAVVPVLVFAGFNAVTAITHRDAEIRAGAIADARRLSEAVDREISSSLDSAQALANLPALDPPADLARFAEIARREQARHPLWLTVLVLDPEGRRLLNTRTPGRLGGPVEPESVRRVVATGRPQVGTMSKGPSEFGIPLRAPVIRGGSVQGIVTVVVRPKGVAETLAAAKLPSAWIVSVLDGSGRIVARSHAADRFLGGSASASALSARRSGSSGLYDGATLEGARTMSAFWKSPSTDWSVHIGIPKAQFEAPLRRSIAFTVVGSAASLLLAALFVALLLRELRLRREEALAVEQSNRLEALGRLTGGVAHDFNNLLMIIQGNAETLQRRVRDESARRPLEAIAEATSRAARLTRELLVFARGGPLQPQPMDVNATIEDFLESLRQAVGRRVDVQAALDPAAGVVEVDRVQFELALLNLAVNARDAMDGQGSILIATRRAGEWVEVALADTGPGIPRDITNRVFDPFFTTKPPGSGTGLGLTQVYGFAKHAGGSARIEGGDGGGAVIVLRLPASSAVVARPPPAPAAPETLSLAGVRVLVLDDNADVRAVTAQHLRQFGAQVVEGAAAADGLAVLETDGVDLVVSDIVMPGALDGLALAERLKAERPDLPVLLVSGYSASTAEAAARGFLVLMKPFTLTELASALGGLLTSAARTREA